MIATLALSVPLAALAQGKPPESVRMTWFGITNWHYQIGDLGIMLDGAVSFKSRRPRPHREAGYRPQDGRPRSRRSAQDRHHRHHPARPPPRRPLARQPLLGEEDQCTLFRGQGRLRGGRCRRRTSRPLHVRRRWRDRQAQPICHHARRPLEPLGDLQLQTDAEPGVSHIRLPVHGRRPEEAAHLLRLQQRRRRRDQ